MRLLILTLLILLLLAGRAVAEPTTLERLASTMSGTYSTADQARGDQNFRDITLHLARIWPGRTDGPWLYLEQALTDAPEHPYRQRVYQLATRADVSFETRVFELTDPIGLTGAWKEPARFAKLDPSSLIPCAGCTVILHAQPDSSFKGGTEGDGCGSTLRGASYATTETTIGNQEIITWERGYNASGVQVWGSIHGGFIFKKSE